MTGKVQRLPTCVLKMLQEHHLTSAPSAVSVSINTAVWMVMCRLPAIFAPLKGCCWPNSVRQAIRPGISASASSISSRPKSAWEMSFTLYCAPAQHSVNQRVAAATQAHTKPPGSAPAHLVALGPLLHCQLPIRHHCHGCKRMFVGETYAAQKSGCTPCSLGAAGVFLAVGPGGTSNRINYGFGAFLQLACKQARATASTSINKRDKYTFCGFITLVTGAWQIIVVFHHCVPAHAMP